MKRKFILFGFLNVLISNLFLQILLFLNLMPIRFSTLLSILFNTILGYFVYGNLVWKVSKILKLKYFLKYTISLFIAWSVLNLGIYFGLNFNLNPNFIKFIFFDYDSFFVCLLIYHAKILDI